jgi:hypothetical protein
MTQRIIAILLIGTFLLTSCGAVAPVEKTKEVKKPFLIDTKFAKDFEKNYRKIWTCGRKFNYFARESRCLKGLFYHSQRRGFGKKMTSIGISD